MRNFGLVVILVANTCLGLNPAHAVNQTPGSREAILIEPYGFAIHPCPMVGMVLEQQGYLVTELVDLVADDDPGDATLTSFGAALRHGHGVFFLATHGSLSGFAVEAYDADFEDFEARNQAYEQYLLSGAWTEDEIYKNWSVDGFHIGIFGTTIGSPIKGFVSNESIVYAVHCDSWSHRSEWTGAREYLGYACHPDSDFARQESDLFWSRLNGDYGKESRSVAAAKSGLTIRHENLGNTVLSPTVASYEPTEDWLYYEPETPVSFEGRITFDCTMWQNQASTVLSDSGPCEIVNPVWVNDHELSFEIEPSGEGHGYIRVSAAEAESEGNRANLDGNQDPDSTDGTGPNNDDWKMYYWFRDDDPWALVDEVRIEEGELLWRVSREVNTLGYRVLATNDRASDEWTLVEEVPARGGGEYRVSIPEGWAYFQLQEKEKTSAGSVWNYLESGPTRAFYVEGPGSRPGRSHRRWPLHVIGLPSAAGEMAEYVRGSRMRGVEADYETVTSLNPELLRPLMAAERSRGRIPVVWPARSSPAAQGVRGAPMEQTTIYLVARGDLGYSGAERLGGRRSHRRAATGGLTVDRLQPEAIRLLGAGRALVAVVLPAGPGRRAGRLEQTCRYPGDVVSLCGRRLLPV